MPWELEKREKFTEFEKDGNKCMEKK